MSCEQDYPGVLDTDFDADLYHEFAIMAHGLSEHSCNETRNERAYRECERAMGVSFDHNAQFENDFYNAHEVTVDDLNDVNLAGKFFSCRLDTNDADVPCVASTAFFCVTLAQNDHRAGSSLKPTYHDFQPNVASDSMLSSRPSVASLFRSFHTASPTTKHRELAQPSVAGPVFQKELAKSRPQGYREQIGSQDVAGEDLDLDCSSIRNIGAVDRLVNIEEVAEGFRAIPEQAIFDIASVPELIDDDSEDDEDENGQTELSYDSSPSTLHFFNQAGINVTTRELQDDFVVAQTTNLAGGYLDIDAQAESEKAQANLDFFDRRSLDNPEAYVSVGHPPSSDRVHCVDCIECLFPCRVNELADPDYFIGPRASFCADASFEVAHPHTFIGYRCERHAKSLQASQEARHGESEAKGIENAPSHRRGDFQELLLPKPYGKKSSFWVDDSMSDDSSISFLTEDGPVPPLRLSRTPSCNKPIRIKKRPARESFDSVELCRNNTQRKPAHKKPRLTSQSSNKSTSLHSRSASASSSISKHSPMATALKGFPGQFEMQPSQDSSQTHKSSESHVFGNHFHANGKVVNTHFIAGSARYSIDLSQSPALRATIEHGNLHHSFAEEMPRSTEEEALRKEAHRECAAARLEGVPVGYYRYFGGHMTVEEYIDARMCVCWDKCFCSKLCTRFGDLACPCAGNLILADDA